MVQTALAPGPHEFISALQDQLVLGVLRLALGSLILVLRVRMDLLAPLAVVILPMAAQAKDIW